MDAGQRGKEKGEKYVYVKDEQGVEYVCRISDLKRLDAMTEEEKADCMQTPGDA